MYNVAEEELDDLWGDEEQKGGSNGHNGGHDPGPNRDGPQSRDNMGGQRGGQREDQGSVPSRGDHGSNRGHSNNSSYSLVCLILQQRNCKGKEDSKIQSLLIGENYNCITSETNIHPFLLNYIFFLFLTQRSISMSC